MRQSLHRHVEFASNIGIVVTAVASCVMAGRLLLHAPSAHTPTVTMPNATRVGLATRSALPGARIALPGVTWSQRDRTVLLILSTRCHFCTDSAPFYKRLSTALRARSHNAGLIAVLPQANGESERYLTGLGVTVDSIVQAPLLTTGVQGTPTILIVDKTGVIQRAWMGRLSAELEREVIGAV